MNTRLVRLADRIGLSFVDRNAVSGRISSRAARLARGGFVWAVASAVMALRRSWRRSAVAGIVAWAVADGAALTLKRLVERPRPRFVPARGPLPRSSAFPSSHASGAAAYVVAAGLNSPATAVATVPLAAAVSWGRLVDRRHFPIDILSGVVLGAGIGAIAHVVANHLVPQRPVESPAHVPAVGRPSLVT